MKREKQMNKRISSNNIEMQRTNELERRNWKEKIQGVFLKSFLTGISLRDVNLTSFIFPHKIDFSISDFKHEIVRSITGDA